MNLRQLARDAVEMIGSMTADPELYAQEPEDIHLVCPV